MKSLTIGLVLDDSLDRPDGVQQMVLQHGAWLRSQGHQVHYIVSDTKRTDIKNIHSVTKSLQLSFNGNVVRMPRLASKTALLELCSSIDFDIFHVQMPYSPLMSGRLIANTSVPVVGTFHILPYGQLASVGTKLLGLLQAETLSKFRATSATSTAAQQFAVRTYRVKPVVIPNPVDIQRFSVRQIRNKENQEFCRIVFLGRLVERKGAIHLLRALADMSPDVRSAIRVEIAGNGPDRHQLTEFVQKHRLKSIVEFLGFVDEADKPKLLSHADIAVFPSTAGESFGIVLVEAMAAHAGVVLGGDNPGYSTVLGEWPETLFDPSNVAQFRDVIERFVTDRHLRKQIGDKQHAAATQYDTSVVGKKFVTLYEQAILDSASDLS